MNIDVSTLNITSLIPQRPPFVMVDRLVSCCITDAVTELRMRPDNIFCEEGMLSAPGMLENMAQSCAARMGWVNMTRNESVKIGVIGEIKKCEFIRQPKVDEVITTYVHIVEDIFNLTLADVVMKVNDETVGFATMKIAKVDDTPKE